MPVKASWYTLYFLILKLFLPIYLFFSLTIIDQQKNILFLYDVMTDLNQFMASYISLIATYWPLDGATPSYMSYFYCVSI